MGSRKRSARQREIAQFKAESGGLDDVFDSERRRGEEAREHRDAARRERACERKMRYRTRDEALDAIARCEERGTRGLTCYRCTYCHGWHLTSHPWE